MTLQTANFDFKTVALSFRIGKIDNTVETAFIVTGLVLAPNALENEYTIHTDKNHSHPFSSSSDL